jgi:hypothetical protein
MATQQTPHNTWARVYNFRRDLALGKKAEMAAAELLASRDNMQVKRFSGDGVNVGTDGLPMFHDIEMEDGHTYEVKRDGKMEVTGNFFIEYRKRVADRTFVDTALTISDAETYILWGSDTFYYLSTTLLRSLLPVLVNGIRQPGPQGKGIISRNTFANEKGNYTCGWLLPAIIVKQHSGILTCDNSALGRGRALMRAVHVAEEKRAGVLRLLALETAAVAEARGRLEAGLLLEGLTEEQVQELFPAA